MKTCFNTVTGHVNRPLSFSHQHLQGVLETFPVFGECTEGEPTNDTDLLIFCDFGMPTAEAFAHQVKSNGGKVVVITFDPPNFHRVRNLESESLVDLVILFDKKFQDVMPKVFITDYFFNESLFPLAPKEYKDEICIFGHIESIYGRFHPDGVTKIDEVYPRDYPHLYSMVQEYSGVYVFDTGSGDHSKGEGLQHYNKAKGVESLMCGRNAYVQDGIQTLKYDKYLTKSFSSKPVEFEQEEIFHLNRESIKSVVEAIGNIL